MEDRSNIIKEAIEYRDKLEKKVEELAQSIVRLQISLDFADNTIKKKDKEIAELEAYMDVNEDFKKAWEELKAENERLKFKLDTVEADYEASEIEIEELKNKLNLLTIAYNHLLELDKYRQKELETKAEATKSNIHNLALLSKAKKTLQEIKAIAMGIMDDDIEEGSAYSDARQIIDLITKAESEG